MSEAPEGTEHYTSSRLWADHVQAVIDELDLDHPVLVGHSYAGYIVCDYVREHGQDKVGATDFVGAATTATEEASGSLIGPSTLESKPDGTADQG